MQIAFAICSVAILFAWPRTSAAVTLADLKADAHLTPARFMSYFCDFKFKLGEKVRKPEEFLASHEGDCDDFATLACSILREKGYTTKLVVVFMPQAVHVVCYVAETGSYLDYNFRKKVEPLVKCEGSLANVATNVASSFHTTWRSVSEVTFRNGARAFASTEFR